MQRSLTGKLETRNTMRKSTVLTLIASLLLALIAMPMAAFAQDTVPGGSIAYGQTVSGEITSSATRIAYTFEGSAGDVVMITMSAVVRGLDSYIELLGPDGALVTQDDDGAGNLNSLIGPYALESNGTYTIVATRFGGSTGTSTGQFELRLTLPTISTLSLGQTESLTLSAQDSFVVYRYTTTAPEILLLEGIRTAGSDNASIHVRNLQGDYLGNSYGDLSTGRVAIDPLYLATPGEFLVVVRREFNYGPEGAVLSSDETLNLDFSMTAISASPLTMDSPITGVLSNDNQTDYYTFNGTAGDILRLTGEVVNDGHYDVMVYAPSGYTINGISTLYSPAGQGDGFALDPLPLNETGLYLVVVRRTMGPAEMPAAVSYNVTLSSTQTPVLSLGVAVEGTVDQTTYERVYRFEGTAGQQVRFTLSGTNSSYGAGISVYGAGPGIPEGQANVFNGSGSAGGTLTYEATLAYTGVYLVRVYNGQYYEFGNVQPASFRLVVDAQ